MAQDRYSGYAARFNNAALTLSQLGQVSIDGGITLSEVIAMGAVDRSAVIAAQAEPRIRLECYDLATLLGTVGITDGYPCTASLGALIQFQKRAANASGIFAGGSNNFNVQSTLGILQVENLGATQDESAGAMAELLYTPLYDGSNAILVANNGVALAGSVGFGSLFYLGGAYLGASQLEGCQSWQYQTGLVLSAKRADGDYAARKASYIRRTPRLTLTFDKLPSMTSGPNSLINAALASTLAVYLRKGAHGGIRVADATLEHIKISFATGGWRADSFSVRETEDGLVTLTAEPIVAPSISIASAIP